MLHSMQAGEAVQRTGEAIKPAGEAVQQTGEAVQQEDEAVQDIEQMRMDSEPKRCNHRVHIVLVEMKQVECICPPSWNVRDGNYNERGWACTPHPHQPGLIFPS
jgi:hypothetical protein